MSDVAEALGMSVGSLYTYAVSKEGWFDLVLKRALAAPGYRLPSTLPAPHRTPQQTVRWLRRRLDFKSDFPLLDAAEQPPHPRRHGMAAASPGTRIRLRNRRSEVRILSGACGNAYS
jgi:AcrR family transcriptional regulator